MYENICPLCKTKFGYANDKPNLYNDSRQGKFHKVFHKDDKERPFRTSTPIADIVDNVTSSFSDSVSDFFYQSWKSGLQTSRRSGAETMTCCGHMIQQPHCYSQIVYVNTVLYPPMYPVINTQVQQVGYRADGTFGLLPMYWPYFVNYS